MRLTCLTFIVVLLLLAEFAANPIESAGAAKGSEGGEHGTKSTNVGKEANKSSRHRRGRHDDDGHSEAQAPEELRKRVKEWRKAVSPDNDEPMERSNRVSGAPSKNKEDSRRRSRLDRGGEPSDRRRVDGHRVDSAPAPATAVKTESRKREENTTGSRRYKKKVEFEKVVEAEGAEKRRAKKPSGVEGDTPAAPEKERRKSDNHEKDRKEKRERKGQGKPTKRSTGDSTAAAPRSGSKRKKSTSEASKNTRQEKAKDTKEGGNQSVGAWRQLAHAFIYDIQLIAGVKVRVRKRAPSQVDERGETKERGESSKGKTPPVGQPRSDAHAAAANPTTNTRKTTKSMPRQPVVDDVVESRNDLLHRYLSLQGSSYACEGTFAQHWVRRYGAGWGGVEGSSCGSERRDGLHHEIMSPPPPQHSPILSSQSPPPSSVPPSTINLVRQRSEQPDRRSRGGRVVEEETRDQAPTPANETSFERPSSTPRTPSLRHTIISRIHEPHEQRQPSHPPLPANTRPPWRPAGSRNPESSDRLTSNSSLRANTFSPALPRQSSPVSRESRVVGVRHRHNDDADWPAYDPRDYESDVESNHYNGRRSEDTYGSEEEEEGIHHTDEENEPVYVSSDSSESNRPHSRYRSPAATRLYSRQSRHIDTSYSDVTRSEDDWPVYNQEDYESDSHHSLPSPDPTSSSFESSHSSENDADGSAQPPVPTAMIPAACRGNTTTTQRLAFERKKSAFYARSEELESGTRYQSVWLNNLRREHIFSDSYPQLHQLQMFEWKKRGGIKVSFRGEPAIDSGGPRREWYRLMSEQMLDADHGLFTTTTEEPPFVFTVFGTAPAGVAEEKYLAYFENLGLFMAKAILQRMLLSCPLSRAIYKALLGQPVDCDDLKWDDRMEYRNRVEYTRNNSVDDLFMTFSVKKRGLNGESSVHDLVPNGRNITVTNENKSEYLTLMCEETLRGGIGRQLDALSRGFHSLIPIKTLTSAGFDASDLELLLIGDPDFDPDESKNKLRISFLGDHYGGTHREGWLRNALKSPEFGSKGRAKFLHFVTGSSRMPTDGIEIDVRTIEGDAGRRPSASTCAKMLKLPRYNSYELFKDRLLEAVSCTVGFDLS